MAAKKDKQGTVEGLRADVQALSDAFWSFRDAMLLDAAVQQAESQSRVTEPTPSMTWSDPNQELVETSAAMMAALGNPQRLRIAMLLARAPISVNQIVQALGLKTTGAAYHHLNVLVHSGIARQPQRGSFEMVETAAPALNAVLTALFGEDAATPEDPIGETAEEPEQAAPARKKGKKKSSASAD